MEHFVEFDHDLTDTERTAIALTLTSALAVNIDTLTWRGEKVEISDKAEMLVAGNKGKQGNSMSTKFEDNYFSITLAISH